MREIHLLARRMLAVTFTAVLTGVGIYALGLAGGVLFPTERDDGRVPASKPARASELTAAVRGSVSEPVSELESAPPEPAPELIDPPPALDGAPACLHDPTRWHGLVEYASDGSIACTYDHEHKDDPRILDDEFGPLEYGEISYPWETHRENELKHRVYGWAAIDGEGQCMATNSRLGITATRFQAHMDGSSGAAVRFHSYSMQARTCDLDDPDNVGLLQVGGHMDYGTLHLRTTTSEEGLHVPLPNDPSELTSARRVHGSTNISEARDRHDFTWYGANSHPDYQVADAVYVGVEVGIRAQDWGPIDPNDPTASHFYGGTQNGSWQDPLHLLSFRIPSALAGPEGRVNYTGWTDRHGRVLVDGGSCTEAGVDCVPLRIDNAKPGYYQFRSLEHGFTEREYDVADPATGESLIGFPN